MTFAGANRSSSRSVWCAAAGRRIGSWTPTSRNLWTRASTSSGVPLAVMPSTYESGTAAINAGGNIYVRPLRTLNAAVNAGGDVHYSGNPQVSMAVANGGDVRHED